MALTCPVDSNSSNLGFTEFLDCATLSINYDKMGTATLSFAVVSVKAEPTPSNYTSLVFGGVTFTTYVTSLEIRQIPGTLVYEHKYNMVGNGCKT
jgi:hypothetical protein